MTPRPVILVVIDGLTPSMLEATIGSGETPMLAALAERGSYRRATSVFPSLTPVCLSSIATGAHGDIHEIPHLVWYDRAEDRIVEYGSSFGAVRAAGIGQTLQDTLVNMNGQHLGANARTMFEALADAGLRTAATNFTAYRGRTRHRSLVPFLPDVMGPERFFFYNLYSSDRTGAPLSWRNRAAGSIDAYATAVGRWLVTRDAFDFFLFYLSDYDYASHEHGPDSALSTLQRCDAAIASLVEAGGGIDAFLERYAVVVMADHGQTRVRESISLAAEVAGHRGRSCAGVESSGSLLPFACLSARPARCRSPPRRPGRRRGDALPRGRARGRAARRGGARVRSGSHDRLRLLGRCVHPRVSGCARPLLVCSRESNAGEVLVSAAEGFEFSDLGGGDHVGGGSHGSLVAGDSEVPLLTVGISAPEPEANVSIVDVAPLVLAHFGVEIPGYALGRAA